MVHIRLQIYRQLQEFFALMEEHKNLRREYQRIQAELRSFYQQNTGTQLSSFSSNSQEVLKRVSHRIRLQVNLDRFFRLFFCFLFTIFIFFVVVVVFWIFIIFHHKNNFYFNCVV